MAVRTICNDVSHYEIQPGYAVVNVFLGSRRKHRDVVVLLDPCKGYHTTGGMKTENFLHGRDVVLEG